MNKNPKKNNIVKLNFENDFGLGERAKIGLIVLRSDQTLEYEFRQIFSLDGVAFYHSRIDNDMVINELSLSKMGDELPKAAALLPRSFNFDVIGYCCTSGSTIIGEETVYKKINKVHPNALITNPLSACKEALKSLGVKRVGFITPYEHYVTNEMRKNLLDSGLEIPVTGSFFESDDFVVGRISEDSILKSILKIGSRKDCDGVFVSCTNLRVVSLIKDAESSIGKPVTSSNHALAWHLLRLSGINDSLENLGKLFLRPLNLNV